MTIYINNKYIRAKSFRLRTRCMDAVDLMADCYVGSIAHVASDSIACVHIMCQVNM